MRFAAALLPILLLLSGCASHREAPGALREPAPGGAVLNVLVINDEYLPVAGARVHIPGLGEGAHTNEAGAARLVVDHPGRYHVEVNRAGFYSNGTQVVVDAGAEETVRVALRDAPGHQHFQDTILYYGTCTLAVHVQGGAAGEGDCRDVAGVPPGRFDWFLSSGFESGSAEVRFSPQPGGLARMRLTVLVPEDAPFSDGTRQKEITGPSPLVLDLPATLVTEELRKPGHLVEFQLGAPPDEAAAAGASQPFFLVAELRYYVPAPAVE